MATTADYQEYAEKHEIFPLMTNLLSDIAVDKPDDPISWLINALKKDIRRIIITGAPASGKGTQCEKIVEKYGVVHLSTGDLLRAAVKARTPLGMQANEYMTTGRLVPDELVIDLVKEKLKSEECKERGWLLDGFPRTKNQALAMQVAGILPTHVILLDVPDEVLMDRALGRRLDPQTGKIYHITTNPPPDDIKDRVIQRDDDKEEKVRTRLVQYHTNLQPLCDAYKDLLVRVKGDQHPNKVFEEVDRCLSTRTTPASLAQTPHRVTRVVLIGGANSGKATLAARLSRKLKSIVVSVEGIVRKKKVESGEIPSVISGEEPTKIEYPPLPELIELIRERLVCPDCIQNGYILLGFPPLEACSASSSSSSSASSSNTTTSTISQLIASLQNNAQTRPSHTLFLKVDPEELVSRQTQRFYHKDTKRKYRRNERGEMKVVDELENFIQEDEQKKVDPRTLSKDSFVQGKEDSDVDAVSNKVRSSLEQIELIRTIYDSTFAESGGSPIIEVDGFGTIQNVYERALTILSQPRVKASFVTVNPMS
ncbi:Nucleoside-triphosphate--adenylate kinase [Monocercomonoides exilis]|uniref:Nucleoside-triphosphate--adenylate kinase n=1 Tax=Monocercomonoides exilis TaxID=2049356 RepID=UPI00355A654A|nr:Nucleoside-triphosphate--adenylate kinase [Monocercomonoides exilis]|eukprot:MONOS_8258.1-p1 / transcript=MONOS_8258.1 / gene=MONOS_8258 / organism=Monocercomonoides_exilis_PA203 / gene_product=Nucleoside-triphosphate--adenylate kinase [EC:2.7.4.10] / transcript_product=Nucleoside-triphosphate--adenylate kinase [EC:2.7.4.10] / location=Mono_scaffold00307:15913-17825(-) / protein_length=539 / sequence_SO=supercontig / SO=protein_coding / is_pseudo=false